MDIRRFKLARPLLLTALLVSFSSSARAVSCTVSAGMSAGDRASLQAEAASLGSAAARGDAVALQKGATPSLAANFNGVSSVVEGLAPLVQGSAVTVENLYALHAGDLQAAGGDAQFFCSQSASPLLVTVTLGQLPPGEYALAIVHATGVAAPQQMALILQNTAASKAPMQWQLAGFSVRPLTLAGHSELWFWQQARDARKTGSGLSAYLDYETALDLARPADFYTSNNLDKLNRELSEVKPKELSEGDGLSLTGPGGDSFSVTGFRIDTGLGAMDVHVDATVPTLGDPVASRTSALSLMAALLAKYPDLRQFHGLWVFEKAADGQTYAIEQPMSALR